MKPALKIGLVVAAVAAAGYALYRFYKRQAMLLMDYDYKIIGARVVGIGQGVATFTVKTRFFNKSRIEAVVQRIYLDLLVEGARVAYVVETKPFVIPAKGSSDIELKISVKSDLILKNAVNILIGGVRKKDLNFTLRGFANVKSGFVSATIPVEYTDKVSSYI